VVIVVAVVMGFFVCDACSVSAHMILVNFVPAYAQITNLCV